jgi:hypothetical protein
MLGTRVGVSRVVMSHAGREYQQPFCLVAGGRRHGHMFLFCPESLLYHTRVQVHISRHSLIRLWTGTKVSPVLLNHVCSLLSCNKGLGSLPALCKRLSMHTVNLTKLCPIADLDFPPAVMFLPGPETTRLDYNLFVKKRSSHQINGIHWNCSLGKYFIIFKKNLHLL